jgi:hypothetical protein
MKLAKLVLAIPLVLMLSANTQCVFETDDDDDDDDHPKKQQEQPMKQHQGEAPSAEMR